jgi:hypothetical protein
MDTVDPQVDVVGLGQATFTEHAGKRVWTYLGKGQMLVAIKPVLMVSPVTSPQPGTRPSSPAPREPANPGPRNRLVAQMSALPKRLSSVLPALRPYRHTGILQNPHDCRPSNLQRLRHLSACHSGLVVLHYLPRVAGQ